MVTPSSVTAPFRTLCAVCAGNAGLPPATRVSDDPGQNGASDAPEHQLPGVGIRIVDG
jgi:hypothetical protein